MEWSRGTMVVAVTVGCSELAVSWSEAVQPLAKCTLIHGPK